MKAILLGTARGSRLHPLTADRPACMVEVRGIPLLHWQLHALRAAGISDCTVVRGWCRTAIRGMGLRTVDNPRWERTRGAESLRRAIDELHGDVLVARADLLCRPHVVVAARDHGADLAVLVDHAWADRTPPSSAVTDPLGLARGEVAMIRLSPHGADLLRDALARVLAAHERGASLPIGAPTFDEASIADLVGLLVREGVPVKPISVRGGWSTIETIEDLRAAEERTSREQWSPPLPSARRIVTAAESPTSRPTLWSSPR